MDVCLIESELFSDDICGRETAFGCIPDFNLQRGVANAKFVIQLVCKLIEICLAEVTPGYD